MQNNAVIFYYEGPSEDIRGIKVTIKSLREHYTGKIVLLHNNVSEVLLSFVKTQNVECVVCSSYKVLFKTSAYHNKLIYTFLYFKKSTHLTNWNVLVCDRGIFVTYVYIAIFVRLRPIIIYII